LAAGIRRLEEAQWTSRYSDDFPLLLLHSIPALASLPKKTSDNSTIVVLEFWNNRGDYVISVRIALAG
jgi:hypothetical protein